MGSSGFSRLLVAVAVLTMTVVVLFMLFVHWIPSVINSEAVPGFVPRETTGPIGLGLVAVAYAVAAIIVAHWNDVTGIRSIAAAAIAGAVTFGFLHLTSWCLEQPFALPLTNSFLFEGGWYMAWAWYLLVLLSSAVHVAATVALSRMLRPSSTRLTSASSRTP